MLAGVLGCFGCSLGAPSRTNATETRQSPLVHRCSSTERDRTKGETEGSWNVTAFGRFIDEVWSLSAKQLSGAALLERRFDLGRGPQAWQLSANWDYSPESGQLAIELTQPYETLESLQLRAELGPSSARSGLAVLEEAYALAGRIDAVRTRRELVLFVGRDDYVDSIVAMRHCIEEASGK